MDPDAIVLNAGFGCYVYGLTPTIAEGCELARKTLESGKAAEKPDFFMGGCDIANHVWYSRNEVPENYGAMESWYLSERACSFG